MSSPTRPCGIRLCRNTSELQHPLCAIHTKALPRDHLDAIHRAFNRYADEQAEGFWIAIAKACSWLQANLGAENEPQRKSWAALVAWVRARDAAREERNPRKKPPPKPGARTTTTGVQLKLV